MSVACALFVRAVHVGGKAAIAWQAVHECRHEYTNRCSDRSCRPAERGAPSLRAVFLATPASAPQAVSPRRARGPNGVQMSNLPLTVTLRLLRPKRRPAIAKEMARSSTMTVRGSDGSESGALGWRPWGDHLTLHLNSPIHPIQHTHQRRAHQHVIVHRRVRHAPAHPLAGPGQHLKLSRRTRMRPDVSSEATTIVVPSSAVQAADCASAVLCRPRSVSRAPLSRTSTRTRGRCGPTARCAASSVALRLRM